jgi:hypothetical protein
MLAIAFACLLIAAAGLTLTVTGLAMSQAPGVPVRLAAKGREILRFGATGLALSLCGIVGVGLAARAVPASYAEGPQADVKVADTFISGGGSPGGSAWESPTRPWP